MTQHSINDIEKLELPKRAENRRTIYLGERVICEIEYNGQRTLTHLVDLSARGLAIVEAEDVRKERAKVHDLVRLYFEIQKKHFVVLGEVANSSEVFFAKKHLARLGIKFQIETPPTIEAFQAKIGESLVQCRHGIRPQARCFDPYFFDELIVFQVNAFTPFGIDLTVSARCKSILPNQPFNLEVFIPGRGEFTVSVVNSNLQYRGKSNYYRLYVRYDEPSEEYLKALAEYLVMFAEVSPRELREQEFVVGELNQAVEIIHAGISESIIQDHHMKPHNFARAKDLNKFERLAIARDVSVKVGPRLVAVFSLAFFESEDTRHKLLAESYNFDFSKLCPQRLELVNFFITEDVQLVDILIPALRHAVRICTQARFRYIFLETSATLKPVFEKFGFASIDKRKGKVSGEASSKDPTWYLMQLDVRDVLLNKEKKVSDGLWSKLYKQLHEYLSRHV